MSENRNDLTIGELPTRAPGEPPLPSAPPRKREPVAAEWQWDPSQTIGELPTRAPKVSEQMMLAKRYRMLRRLREGGMGSVWLAEDTKLDNRRVAIKMLPAVLAGKKASCRQVQREALTAMKLSHPNIATVRAFEEEGGSPFLVMDYIEGKGLNEILDAKGKLSEAETLALLGPVAAALDYAHGKGVVHRDVKPGNVVVAKDGTPFVLDFGIAREIQETMTRVTGKLSSGTLLYMSPEQLNGESPDASQDVYSFAAMAYECLTGDPPFCRGGIEDQIKNKKPAELPESLGEGVRRGVMAGLAKSAAGRPGSCAGVLGKRGASGGGRSAGKKGRVWLWWAAGALLLAACGAGLWWRGWGRLAGGTVTSTEETWQDDAVPGAAPSPEETVWQEEEKRAEAERLAEQKAAEEA